MGLIGQGYSEFSADLEEGHPLHLEITHEVEWADSDDRVDWYVLRLDVSPTASIRLVVDSLDQLSAIAEKLAHAVGERRRRDALAAAPHQRAEGGGR